MTLKLGTKDFLKGYIGTKEIEKAYLGNTLVYTKIVPNGLLNGLVSYYSFEGNANDVHGSNNGTVSGATSVADGYSFDGVNDQITVGATMYTSGDAFTISLRVKSDVAVSTASKYILGYLGVAMTWGHPSSVYQQGWNIYTNIDSFPVVKYTTPLTTGTWYNMVCTYSGGTAGTLKVYLGGVLENTTIITGTPRIGTTLALGSSSGANYWGGTIRSAGFWNAEKNSTDIAILNNSGAGLPYSSFTT